MRIPPHEPLDRADWRGLWEDAAGRLGRISVIATPGRPARTVPFTGVTEAPFALLCLGGSISVSTADGGSFVLHERDGCLWAPGTWVANWHADCPCYLRATFDHDHVFAAIKDLQRCRREGRRPDLYGLTLPGPVDPATSGLLTNLAGTAWHPATAAAAFTLAMWAVHHRLGRPEAGDGSGAWSRLREIAGRDPSPSRAAAAADLGVVPETVSRLCRRHGGCTWLELLDGSRLARAELRLRGGEPLARIAQACGFASSGHLIRRFRLRHGMTPDVWRRQLPLLVQRKRKPG